MSDSNQPIERTSPVLWSIALIVVIAVAVTIFMNMLGKGLKHAKAHPLPEIAEATGPFVPDHAAMLELVAAADAELVSEGAKLYAQNCTACHGTDGGEPNSASPSARMFTSQEMLNAGDDMSGAHPWRMYVTLSEGYAGEAQMPAQFANNELGSRQRYAVIAYIRETFLKDQNPAQYVADVDLSAGPWPEPNLDGGAAEIDRAALAEMPITIPITGSMVAFAKEQAVAETAIPALESAIGAGSSRTAVILGQADSWRSDDHLALGLVNAAKADDAAQFVALATSHADLRALATVSAGDLTTFFAHLAESE